jgi:hypothetical protein
MAMAVAPEPAAVNIEVVAEVIKPKKKRKYYPRKPKTTK